MQKIYKAKIVLEVEIEAVNNVEAEEILHNVFLVDNPDFKIKVEQVDVEELTRI